MEPDHSDPPGAPSLSVDPTAPGSGVAPSIWVRVLAPLLGFGSLSVLLTWPLVRNLDTHVIKAKWFYDSMVNLMILGSRVHSAFGISKLGIYDNYFCAPVPNSIVFNESHLGLFLLYAPFYLITRDPLLSYNLLLLTGTTLSACFTYALVKHLSRSPLAAIFSAVAFAFSPYVFFEMGRIQLVSTQWIPLAILALHRAAETGRLRWIALLGAAFVMQVGSCMYYAMFLVLVLPLLGTWLLVHHRRFELRFWLQLAAVVAVAGIVAGLMVRPYLEMRDRLPLTRSESKVRQYSGEPWHLAAVYPENKTLTFLHDEARGGAEPIAFPGFSVILLALAGLVVPLLGRLRRGLGPERKKAAILLLGTPLVLTLAVYLSLLTLDMVAGLGLVLLVLLAWKIRVRGFGYPTLPAAYFACLLLALALFLGPEAWRDEEGLRRVRGLYYYLYHYVPTFDGIRYVSRLAVMISICLAVLAGLGASHIFGALKRRGSRLAVFALLLVVLVAELLNAPVSLARLPSKKNLPSVHKWLAAHPGPEPIAIMPAYPKGFYGARNDYLTLFHRRRTINGKSSWMAPVTYLWIKESARYPSVTADRMLKTLGAKYLVLHSREIAKRRLARIEKHLGRLPEFVLRHDSADGKVYEIVDRSDPYAGLMPTPELPAAAVALPRSQLSANAHRHPEEVGGAIDADPSTYWASHRNQRNGDWFQLNLAEPRKVWALEFSEFREAFDAPQSFRLEVSQDGANWQNVFERSGARIFLDQVYRPKDFVFRVVLPEPTLAKHVRLTILQPVTGRWWTIHQAGLFVAP